MEGKGGKNDANYAAVICEAVNRPSKRFVPVKSSNQQGILCVHPLREGLREERTSCIYRLRGLMAEFGIVVSKSPEKLRENLQDLIEDAENGLDWLAKLAIQEHYSHWNSIDQRIACSDQRTNAQITEDAQAKVAKQLIGVGPLTASALVVTAVHFKQFKNDAQFGPWLGLMPRQS